MLSKGLNPACSPPFRQLRDGKIFHLETGSRNERGREYFWRCSRCSTTMNVTLRNGAPVVEQRLVKLISGELLEQPAEEQSYNPDPI